MERSSVFSALGAFTVDWDDLGLIRLYLPGQSIPAAETPLQELPWDLARQLEDYACGKRRDWNLPFSLTGSPFRLAVLYACRDIPYGETRTYGQLAALAGYPGAARAVGQVMAHNPLPLIIPCHRVVPASGGIGSYAGGQDMKARLLELEARYR